MVRALQLAAVGAFYDANRTDAVMRAAHVAAGFRSLLLRNSHNTTRIEWGMRRPNRLAKAVSIKQNAVRGKVRTRPLEMII